MRWRSGAPTGTCASRIRCTSRRASCCTPRPGRTSTAPRVTLTGRAPSTSRGHGTSPPPVRRSSTSRPTTSSTVPSASRTSRAIRSLRSVSTGARSSRARRKCAPAGSCARRGCSAPPGTTSCARCCASRRSWTRSEWSTTSVARRRTWGTLPSRRRSCSTGRRGSGTWPPRATAPGPTSPRRSSRRRGSDPRAADLDGRVPTAGTAPRLLGAAQRARGRPSSAALARRGARGSGAPRG